MRRPGVQAMYKAEYERCENPKRGAILKLFEVAGVDTAVVKVGAAAGGGKVLWGVGGEIRFD